MRASDKEKKAECICVCVNLHAASVTKQCAAKMANKNKCRLFASLPLTVSLSLTPVEGERAGGKRVALMRLKWNHLGAEKEWMALYTAGDPFSAPRCEKC